MMKPHRELPQKRRFFVLDYPHPTKDTRLNLRDGWIYKRRPRLFFEKSQFINELDKLTQACEKVESGEIRL